MKASIHPLVGFDSIFIMSLASSNPLATLGAKNLPQFDKDKQECVESPKICSTSKKLTV